MEQPGKNMKIPKITIQQLLEAGVHLGHKTLRWNPKMKKYIFGKRDSIHIIDLTQTLELTNEALEKVYNSDFIDTTNEVIDCDSIDEGIKIGIDYLPSPDGSQGGDGNVWAEADETTIRRSDGRYDPPYKPGTVVEVCPGDEVTEPGGKVILIEGTDCTQITAKSPEEVDIDRPFATSDTGEYPVLLTIDSINVVDVVIIVDYIINSTDDELECSDINNDEDINVVDIVQLVNLILN